MSRREIAALVAVGVALGGCGKADLHGARTGPRVPGPSRGGPAPATPRAAPHAEAPGAGRGLDQRQALKPALGESSVALPVPLTARAAATFAGAVGLTRADIAGGAVQAPSTSPRRDEQEAAKCSGLSAKAIGGGRSREFVRGKGLDRENFSSSVEVLSSEAIVRRDLEYAESSAGLRCYSRVVGKNLQAEEHARVQLLGVKVTPIRVRISDGQSAAGVRIAARVGVPRAGLAVALYSDAVSLPYGPAELNLYSTSFVQPVPIRTQQQLLTLMRERARLSRL